MQAVKKMFGKSHEPVAAKQHSLGSSSASSSSASSASETTLSHAPDLKHARNTSLKQGVAVGLPDAAQGRGVAEYTDAHIHSSDAHMPVTEVHSKTVAGQDVAYKSKSIEVPVTKFVKETELVPEVVMEKKTEEKPVTVTERVPVIEKDVVMRTESVTREELVLDQELVQKPVTVMKPVFTEKPRIAEKVVHLARPDEYLKKVKVVRPEEVFKTVKVQRPVERKRTVTVTRPVAVKRTVTVEVPVQTKDRVNITVPELRDAKMDIEVPHTEEHVVKYNEPVTVIRKADEPKLTRHLSKATSASSSASSNSDADLKRTDSDFEAAIARSESSRNWAEIPVGLPFTEMVERAKKFSVTTLRPEVVDYRETWMKPTPYTKLGYKMEPREIEIVETKFEEFEEEVIETVLEEYEEQVEISIMHEVEEEWPVHREREEAVTTSEVTREPVQAMVPELSTETVEVDVPRTITHKEHIQKPETVEREVMIEQPRTIMKKVSVEVPVEKMREVTVEKPVTEYVKKSIEVPETVSKDVHVQDISERTETVRDEHAEHHRGAVEYRTAGTVMKPTAVAGNVAVEEGAGIVAVDKTHLEATAKRRAANMKTGAAVDARNLSRSSSLSDAVAVEAAVPDAVISDSLSQPSLGSSVNVGGTFVKGADAGKARAMIDGDLKGEHYTRVAKVEGHRASANKIVSDALTSATSLSSASSMSSSDLEEGNERVKYTTTGTLKPKKKKGLMGRIKDKIKA